MTNKPSAAMHMAEAEVSQAMDELRNQLGWLESVISRLEADIERGETAIQRSYINAYGSNVDNAAGRVAAAVRTRQIVQWAEMDAGVNHD